MKFKYKFSKPVYIFFGLFYVAAAVTFGWNLVRLINSFSNPIGMSEFNYISLGLSLLLPIVFGAIITAALVSSSYTVENGKMTVSYGFLKDEYFIKDVGSIIRNIRTNRLTVVFKDGAACRILIDEKDFDEFSSLLMQTERSIVYGETDEEESKK
ncbi:MAG: hypothetical protein J5903_03875 [Clostridia bacterium]|nr:hypothetical protein [Clostridia bacterium]